MSEDKMSKEDIDKLRVKMMGERQEALDHLRALADKGDEAADVYRRWLEASNVEEQMFENIMHDTMTAGQVIYAMIRQFTTNVSFLMKHSPDPDHIRMTIIPAIFNGIGVGVMMGVHSTDDADESDVPGFRFPPTSGKPN